jgi:hypothetical protein
MGIVGGSVYLTGCEHKRDYSAALKQVDSLQQCIGVSAKELAGVDTAQVKNGIYKINTTLTQLDSIVGDTIHDAETARELLAYSILKKPLQVFIDTLGYMQAQLAQTHKQLSNLANDFSKQIISDTLAVKALNTETENAGALIAATTILVKAVNEHMTKLSDNETRIQQIIAILSKRTQQKGKRRK